MFEYFQKREWKILVFRTIFNLAIQLFKKRLTYPDFTVFWQYRVASFFSQRIRSFPKKKGSLQTLSKNPKVQIDSRQPLVVTVLDK